MKLKDFKFIYIIIMSLFISHQTIAQKNNFNGYIYSSIDSSKLDNVEIYDYEKGLITNSNNDGFFQFQDSRKKIKLVFYKLNYDYLIKTIDTDNPNSKIYLKFKSINLKEVEITDQNNFRSNKLSDVVEDAIFAGKKTNRILLKDPIANTATNNARQIYNKVSGLNIFQNDDGGLQLNIGARGLNPSRSSNFNTRQNSYDISADVLGYPESYYTPPIEGLKEIQFVKGASSLQYGTQFGGFINFILKKPKKNNHHQVIFRNSIGSNKLYTNFTSISETDSLFSYYMFMNYKNGKGFRDNSKFESLNLYSYLSYILSKKIKLSYEITYLNYLSQQAGGLTDQMFYEDPYQSNRQRNWFKVKWILHNTKLNYDINKKNKITFNFFLLDAHRFALGFRDNRVDQIDPLTERDLIKGYFKNYGSELRYIKKFNFYKENKSVLLLGAKSYKSNNSSQQGPGSSGFDANFNFYNEIYPYYSSQSYYRYPNLNYSFFGENIFYLSNNLSFTPGFRLEHINTQSDGFYRNIRIDLTQNPIFDSTYFESRNNTRNFVLYGAGISYKSTKNYEIYVNFSQNYRSITFSDMSIKNPSFQIDPELKDENGYTNDFGLRGEYKSILRFDISFFNLFYNNRIGMITKKIEDIPGFYSIKTERTNVGDALIKGLESIVEFNILKGKNKINGYVNYSFIKSKYIRSETNGVVGNEVEYTPKHNIKTGVSINYKDHSANIQYNYISSQFTDASNATESDITGIIGQIPAYSILDFSYKIRYKKSAVFININNLLNNKYFTRRASGYPGPGIIPAQDRNYTITFEKEF